MTVGTEITAETNVTASTKISAGAITLTFAAITATYTLVSVLIAG